MKKAVLIIFVSFWVSFWASFSAGFAAKAPVSHSSAASSAASSAVWSGAVYELPDPSSFSAIYAVSDVHGMSDSIRASLRAAKLIDPADHWTGANSLLLVVGDSIDKGPDSVGVLDLWRALALQASASGGAVVHLLGNHEAELLADPESNLTKVLSQELESKHLSVDDLASASSPRGAFLRSEPLAAKIGSWVFCHAGFFPDMSWDEFKAQASSILGSGNYSDDFLQGKQSILEAKNWWKKSSDRKSYLKRLGQIGINGVIQGHQPEAYAISNRIGSIEGGHLVKIDCGASPPAGSNPIEILKFPHPAQLLTGTAPDMTVIHPNGTTQTLTITDSPGDLSTPNVDLD